jgi:TonB family protein
MEAFGSYLLKSAVWLTGFAIIYFLFLRNERFFLLKRFYLISGILVSFIFPLITIHYQVELPAPVSAPVDPFPATFESSSIIPQTAVIKKFNYNYIIAGLYLAGIILLALRTAWHFRHMFKTIKKAKINNRGPARLIRASEYATSFSFFNYVFVNPSISENEVEEIMNHELVHVRQKHWFDLLLGEILRLIQWANPFAWIYTGFIRLNHEYLADEIALQRTSDPAIYKAALLNQIFRAPVISLSNSFNYSLNKKRFDMMKKIIVSPYRKLKVLFVIPVFAIVLYAFAIPEYHFTDPAIVSKVEEMTIYQAPVIVQKEVKGIVLKEDGKPLEGVNIMCTGAAGNASVATTGTDGKFMFNNVQVDAMLLFSCRGYKRISLKPDFTKEMTVKMEKDPEYKAPEGPAQPAFQRPTPIVTVDGVITDKSASEVRKELGYNMGITKMLMGKEATDKYGEKGANGVMEIITRKKALEMGLKPPYPRLAPEDYPTFQGQRFSAFNQWVAGQVKYPSEAQSRQIEGWVSLNFTIELNGTLSNIVSTIPVDPILRDEVIRVVQSAPKWEPPKNPNVDEPFTPSVTLRFKLQDQITPEAPFVVVEQMPMYPGGDVELLNFLKTNTKYPEAARAEKIEGRVIIRFVVTTEGKAEAISVLKGIHPLLDAEAIRVVSSLSGWQPGMQGGNAVNVWYMVPINFSLATPEQPE